MNESSWKRITEAVQRTMRLFKCLISSLLKNCFGAPFRASKRRGTSLFVGFSRAAMPYCAHSSTFEILFQQAVSRVTRHVDSPFRLPRSAPRAGPVFRFQTQNETTPQTRTYNPVPCLT